jgi:hypothetical protein
MASRTQEEKIIVLAEAAGPMTRRTIRSPSPRSKSCREIPRATLLGRQRLVKFADLRRQIDDSSEIDLADVGPLRPPAAARETAIARPLPRPPPMTTAILPPRMPTLFLLL